MVQCRSEASSIGRRRAGLCTACRIANTPLPLPEESEGHPEYQLPGIGKARAADVPC